MKIALVELKSRDYLNIYSFIKMPRGIPLLASILQEFGHEVVCFAEAVTKFEWRELLSYDLVGFSIITCTANPTYDLIGKLIKAGYKGKIVVGGPHATVKPEESLIAGADFVVRHEGDKTLPQLVSALENQACLEIVKGISFWQDDTIKKNPDQEFLTCEEISVLPFPAFNTIRGYEEMRQISITLSRGCPFECDFCGVKKMCGSYRFTTVDSRIRQLKTLRDRYPKFWQNCIIFFADDNFFGNHESRKVTEEMLWQMIAQNLIPPNGWLCQMRVTNADLATTTLMKNAGCRVVCLGIESLNDKILKEVHKGQTAATIHDGLVNLHVAGIETLAMTIAGLPGDTFWSFFRGIRQLHKWGITYLQVLAIVPLLGTKMTERLLESGLKLPRNYDRYNGMHVLLKSDRVSKLGVWMAVNAVTIWFYFFTIHGQKLWVKYFRTYWKMIFLTIRQWLKWPWFH